MCMQPLEDRRTTENTSIMANFASMSGTPEYGHGSATDSFFRTAPLVTSEDGVKAQKRVYDELSAKLEKIQPGIMDNV